MDDGFLPGSTGAVTGVGCDTGTVGFVEAGPETAGVGADPTGAGAGTGAAFATTGAGAVAVEAANGVAAFGVTSVGSDTGVGRGVGIDTIGMVGMPATSDIVAAASLSAAAKSSAVW